MTQAPLYGKETAWDHTISCRVSQMSGIQTTDLFLRVELFQETRLCSVDGVLFFSGLHHEERLRWQGIQPVIVCGLSDFQYWLSGGSYNPNSCFRDE